VSPAPTPWSIARNSGAPARLLLLLVLGALLYGLGVQAARACLPLIAAHEHIEGTATGADQDRCHDEQTPSQVVCESHCRTDAQSNRVSLSFDLPAAAPLATVVVMAPIVSVASGASDLTVLRDAGPPLHLLFQRLLR